ncbi:MAG: YciI family protein [Myxococcota bacterium]
MQYAILIYEPDEELDKRTDPDQHDAYMAPYHSYVAALREAGVMVGGESLRQPSTATTVTVRAGERHIQDGPVAHSREQLGGFLIIEVSDLDAALDWASRCPAAHTGRVEVRPCGLDTPR